MAACLLVPLALATTGCASVPMKQGGTLSSYESLGQAKGRLGKSRSYVDGKALESVKTVSIVPASFTPEAAARIKTTADRAMVLNALDRAACVALSDRYQVLSTGQHTDLKVRAVVTDVVPTNKAMAGLATAVTLGSSVALPVSVPRLPVGLGGLAVEAEALDRSGKQRAAIVWARGANSIQNAPRLSEVGDAYELASKFGDDFASMIVKGREKKGLSISLPSGQKLRSNLGGRPKHVACEAFGRAPGLAGMVGAKIGAPPQWTDRQPKPQTP